MGRGQRCGVGQTCPLQNQTSPQVRSEMVADVFPVHPAQEAVMVTLPP